MGQYLNINIRYILVRNTGLNYIFKLERPIDLNPFWSACNCTNRTIPLHPDFKYVLYQLNALCNNTLAEINKVISEIFEMIPQHDLRAGENIVP